MTRVLVLVAIALLVAYLLNEGLARLRRRLGELLGRAPGRGATANGGRVGGELVACRACGVHVLRARALPGPGGHAATPPGAPRASGASGFYCSESCRSRAGAAT